MKQPVICDVGARDGLQNEPVTLAPAVRAELVRRLVAAGLRHVEAASFVNPALVPQMAGAEQVVEALSPELLGQATLCGLALNERGYERLAAMALPEVHVAFGVSESFNRRNQNATVEQSLAAAARIVERAHLDGRRATVTLAVAFGCPFEGEVAPRRPLELAERIAQAGADGILFADTIGVGVPRQVGQLVRGAADLGLPVGVHLHDTRNTAIANAYVALESGATLLDGSVGGLGGCPFAPRATGNVATEDLVYLLEREGIGTGIDLDALIRVAEWLEGQLGHELPGRVSRAGGFPPRER